MVSAEPFHSLLDSDETGSSSRISFSSEFLDESNFITICPNPQAEREERGRGARNVDFEFLSENLNSSSSMIAADELFLEGKMLPFWHAEKLKRISLKSEGADEEARKKEKSKMTWFVDEDPSPRPPKCSGLWMELLKLKKLQRTENIRRDSEKCSKRTKKGQVSMRIRPLLNVPPICTHATALPPLFSFRRGSRLHR